MTDHDDVMPVSIENLLFENAQLKAALKEHELRLVTLNIEVEHLKRMLFGQKAERVKNIEAQQSLLSLMGELGRLPVGDVAAVERIEAMVDDLNDDLKDPIADGQVTPDAKHPEPTKPPKNRGRPHGRAKLDESALPIISIVIEPSERHEAGGELLVKIGEEVSFHLDHKPGSCVRVKVVRPKYLRPHDVGTAATSASWSMSADKPGSSDPAPLVKVLCAPPPDLPISRGLAGPGLLAHVLVSKYADHQPLHRQARIFKREGVHLPRSTLCGFVQGASALLVHVVDAMWKDAKDNAPILLTDATGVLIRAPEKCRRGHFQVFIAPLRHVVFKYFDELKGKVIADALQGFTGTLQSDAASVYHEVYRRTPSVIEAGCWAHARRGFFEALSSDRQRALIGIGFIGALYDAHDAAKSDSGTDGPKRKALAEPILNDLVLWRDRERARVDKGTPIEKALGYLERQWQPLTRFLDDGRLRLDNNPSELELRHEAVGRKNWLFCATTGGAHWNATVVSLIASCRIRDVEPSAYLRDILTILPAWDRARVLELAPAHWPETRETPELRKLLEDRRLLGRTPPAHERDDGADGVGGA